MPTVDIAATGMNIQRCMQKKGIAARDIQDACGFTTPNAVYKWIRGACMPTIDNMIIIADICGVTINDIVAVKRI